jgi:hypothetical protein
LITDAEPICHYFKAIAGSISKDLEREIKPTTFFEFHQFDVDEALQRMDDRTTQDGLKVHAAEADDQCHTHKRSCPRLKLAAHRMCAQDQIFIHTAKIIVVQIKTSVTIRVHYYKSILSYYIKD